ncbi:MAG TPA: GDP-L-fucose synthase [Candidatus Babeliales bacterium]|nr:GDP-L-fucose synthase [Candidatus Babeliales bacterium]
MHLNEKIYIAGHEGLVGSALVRLLKTRGFQHLIIRKKDELDLRNQKDVNNFFLEEKPDFVFLAAALVGGIKANNDFPASFLYDNLMIQTNVMHAAHAYGVKKLLFLGSSCIYPRLCEQPIKEEYLMTGSLEATNEAYAIAKISGIKLAQAYHKQYGSNFICAMPTNLYGPGDTFDKERSHVIPALLMKIHEAKEKNIPSIALWGTGNALREFLYADDLAVALFILMGRYNGSEIINVGSGQEISIARLATMICEIVNYPGVITFDSGQPDGTPRKILDSSRINQLGWQAETNLRDGLEKAYAWYLKKLKGEHNETHNLAREPFMQRETHCI